MNHERRESQRVTRRHGHNHPQKVDGCPIVTIPKDFLLNFVVTTYSGAPIAGNIHGDGVNDVYATIVNGTQIALASSGTVGAHLNLGGIPFNNMTLSGALNLDPLRNTLTFSQGSSLGFDLGGQYISFTATDNAGGQLQFGANDLTRQSSLNVIGEINCSLGGSIVYNGWLMWLANSLLTRRATVSAS